MRRLSRRLLLPTMVLSAATACAKGNATPAACDGCRITRVYLERDVLPADSDAVVSRDGRDVRLIAPADSGFIRIEENGATRTAVLPEETRIRELLVLRWPDRLVFAGRALGTNAVFMAGVRDGRLVLHRDFEVPSPPRRDRAPLYRLAADPRGGFVAIDAVSHTLLRYDASGRLVQRQRQVPHWFVNPTRGLARHRSVVEAVDVDDDGRIWVFARQPTQEAAVAWRTETARTAGGRIGADSLDLYRTVATVLDADGRTVLASAWMPAELLNVRDGIIEVRERGPDGGAVFRAARLTLAVPN